ncbi:MAG: FIST N-terminal domain-containing protein [Thermodesulfobacteriota bacterium]
MLRIASAFSSHADTAQACRDIAAGLEERLGSSRAEAAIFFATPGHGPAYGRIERAIREIAGVGEVVGCSAAGVVSREGERERGAAVSALALHGDFAVRRIFVPALRGRADEVGRELGRVVASLDAEPRTLLLLADSYNLAPDELLAGVESAAPGTVVLGAGASEDGSIGETTVVGRGVAASNAVAALAIGGLDVRSMVTQGGTPVGRWWTVTRAETNRILELEGRPALEVFLAEIPELLRADLREALRCTRAALVEQQADGDQTPPYVVRRLLGADVSQGALLVGDEVIAGMRFAVAVRDPAAARESFARNVEEFAAAGRGIAGALYFNSVERGEALYGIPDLDTAYLRRSLGDVELAGFFSGAELAPLGGRNRFHQSSGVLVGFAAG